MSYNLFDYHIKLIYDNEEKEYIASIEEIKGCSAFGDTPQEALNELETAFQGCMEVSAKKGYPIPTPKNLGQLKDYSGKISLRMPKSLHKDIAKRAEEDNVSINQELIYCITKGLEKKNSESEYDKAS